MAVEIEWIDSVSPAATGNKIYRDTVPPTGEVEIADIANGIQIYEDATADPGTEYKYEVQAHDGAGGETTQEVQGENMEYITTAVDPYGPELMTDLNAANYTNETNAFTGIAAASQMYLGTNDTYKNNGNWSVELQSSSTGGNSYGNWPFQVESGKSYMLKFWWYPNSTNSRLRLRDAMAEQNIYPTTANVGEVIEMPFTATSTGTGNIRFYSSDAANAGGEFGYLDSLSLKEVL